VWRQDTRGHALAPTPGHTRPYAVPPARWVEPRRATRCQERKLQEWRLDCRDDRGTQMAVVSRTVVRQDRDSRMTNKTNNSLTPVAHQPGRLPARTNNRSRSANGCGLSYGRSPRPGQPNDNKTNNSLTPVAHQPGRLPAGRITHSRREERKWLRSLVRSFAKTGTAE
jgi:hypothetical protein